MGQQKGNPTPSYQNQAYETLRPNTNARENRDYGTKPVMIDDTTTLNEVVDITFETDAVAAMVSASLNTTIYAVSASIGNNITAVSGSTNSTILAVSGSTNSTILAVSSSINTTIGAVSSSINTTIGAVSSSIDTRLNAVSQSLSSSINIPGTYANDTAAATAGVRIGGLYHTTGTVKVRLT
jgi:hypothetical protein